MKFIKQSFLLIMLIHITAGIVFCAAFLKNRAENYKPVEISDVEGDRNILQNIKISGTVADRLHKQEFEIANGTAKTEFSAVTKEEWKDFYSKPIADMFDFVSYEYEPFEILPSLKQSK